MYVNLVWVILGPEKNTTIMSNVIITHHNNKIIYVSVLSTRNSALCAPETIYHRNVIIFVSILLAQCLAIRTEMLHGYWMSWIWEDHNYRNRFIFSPPPSNKIHWNSLFSGLKLNIKWGPPQVSKVKLSNIIFIWFKSSLALRSGLMGIFLGKQQEYQ